MLKELLQKNIEVIIRVVLIEKEVIVEDEGDLNPQKLEDQEVMNTGEDLIVK